MIYEIICYNGSFPEDSRARGFVYQSFQRLFGALALRWLDVAARLIFARGIFAAK